MIKTLQNALKQDREDFDIPRTVQEAVPIRRLWPDGIFQFGSKYSKTIRFTDINYAIASKEDKTSMFLGYSELLNALDAGSTTKLTINNKRLNRQDFEQKILLPRQNDYLDGYRAEYNAMLMDKVTDSSNSVVQERYVTLSVHRKSIEEARTFFDRVTADVTTRLNHLDSHSEELDAVERLRVLHDFYRTGEETEFHVDLRDLMRKGHSFKDTICPDSLEFKKDHFIMGDKFGRVLFLKEYASYIKDSMINELTALNHTMMLSIDVIPVPTDEAVREMQSRLLGVETNVTNWQRRQNNNNNFSAVVPYDLEQQRKETREMLDDLTTRDQRMMFAVVTLVHLADSKEELDSDTDALQSTARKHLCQLATLNWQQADGLVTALPLGLRRIDALRTLTTEALAVLMPFKAQEVRDQGGVYYGQNTISKNLIIVYVSLNYRLGVLGYLYLGRLLGERYQHTGNLGILDQLAAIRWVYENIAAFGGDPERITVMGESAGAKAISALLVRPEMKTYCKQVCLSSGAYQCIRDEETADRLARRFLNRAGLDRAEELLTMPVDELLAAQKKLCAEPGSTCLFGPVADGKVIPYDWPDRLDWGGNAIVGSCRNEVVFYKLFDPDFVEHAPGIADTLFGVNAEIANRDFAELVKPDFDQAARADLWVKILTDYMYRTYSARMARRLVKNGGHVWYYSTEYSKATHCLDQWLAFDGHGLPDEPDGPVKDAAPRLGRVIYESYVRFFLSGDPNGEGIPAWPKLSEGDMRRMMWDVEPRVETVPEGDVLDHFPEYVFKL